MVAIDEPPDFAQIRVRRVAKGVKQIDDRVKALVARDVIDRFFVECPLRQRRDVSAEHQQRYIGVEVLDRGRNGGRARHVLR